MRRLLISISWCWLMAVPMDAQVSNASVYLPGNLYTIYHKGDVSGYFWCYSNRAISPTEHEYRVEVMDFAMRNTNEFNIIGPVVSRLVNVASNGHAVFMQFKGDVYEGPRVMVADFKGNILANERTGVAIAAGKLRDDVYAVDHGFLFKQAVDADHMRYDFIDNAGKMVWSLKTAGEEMDWKKQDVRLCNDAVIAMTDEGVDHLRIFSMQDGHEIVKLPLLHGDNRLYPTTVHTDTDRIILLGQYITDEKDKILPVKPDGLFKMVLSADGRVQQTQMQSWQTMWSDHLPDLETDNGKPKDYVWIHQFMTKGNKLHAVGEVFDPGIDPANAKSVEYGEKQYVGISLTDDFTVDTICVFHFDSVYWGSRNTDYQHEVSHRVNSYRAGKTDFRYGVSAMAGPLLHGVFLTEGKTGKGLFRQPQIEAVGIGRDGHWHHSATPVSWRASQVIVLPSRSGYVAYYEVFVIDQYTQYYLPGLKKFDL